MIPMLKKVNLIKAKNKRAEAICFGFFIYIMFVATSCKQDDYLTAQDIVARSVVVHGGLIKWDSITTLSFDKITILFTKDGAVESSITQQQLFKFQPELQGQIVSANEGIVGLYYNGKEFKKRINDSIYTLTDSTELVTAKNSFFAANFVVSQPFKLLDEGISLSFGGIETLDDKQVFVIDVGYENDTNTSDKWTYYFDVDSYQLVANKVIHNSNVSLIKNLEFNSDTGIIFNAHRKSYTLDSSGDIDYMRAEYFYENFELSQ